MPTGINIYTAISFLCLHVTVWLIVEQFVQRQRVLGFWREIVRALNSQSSVSVEGHVSLPHTTLRVFTIAWYLTSCIAGIPVSPTKYELRDYAREEFERHRNITDLVSWFGHTVRVVG